MMSTPQMHREFLREVSERITAIESELEELRAVARFHKSRADSAISPENGLHSVTGGFTDEVEVSGSGTSFEDLSKHAAAAAVLAASGVSMKVGDICDELIRRDYSAHLGRRLLYNSIYTALKRRTDLFVAEDGKWRLREVNEGAIGLTE